MPCVSCVVSRAADPVASIAQHYSPGTPLVLVGTKEDLRGTVGQLDDGREEVSYEKGKELRDEIKALAYLECSAITKNGIKVPWQQERVVCTTGASIAEKYACARAGRVRYCGASL